MSCFHGSVRSHVEYFEIDAGQLRQDSSYLPIYFQCADCPPVLFEVLCFNNSVQIGGYPWHFIYTPPQKNHKGTHHVCSLKDSTLVCLNNIPDTERYHR